MIIRHPPRSGRRRVTHLLVAAALGLVAVVLAPASPAQAQSGDKDLEGTIQTEFGPVTATDEDLLDRVMYAGLWEIPAGRLAADRGTDERVREVGQLLVDEHTELNRITEEAAAKVGVELPNDAHPDHQNFINRMASKSGEALDVEFVTLVRLAHGDVYPLIAYVRSTTQNSVIREVADIAEEFVKRHMDYLESTGAVDWVQIPPPPMPAEETSRILTTEPGGINPVLIWIILGVAAVAGSITVVRTVRPR